MPSPAVAAQKAAAQARAALSAHPINPGVFGLLNRGEQLRAIAERSATGGFGQRTVHSGSQRGVKPLFPEAFTVLGGDNPSPFQDFNRLNTRLTTHGPKGAPPGLGFLSGIYGSEESTLGSVNLGFLATAGAEIADLISGLIGLGAGRPKMQDTIDAALKLLNSPNQAAQRFGAELAYLANRGIPISDSDPAIQKLIGQEFHQAVLGLEQTLGWTQQQAFNHLSGILQGQGINIPAGKPLGGSKVSLASLAGPRSRRPAPSTGSPPVQTGPTPPSTPPILPSPTPSSTLPTGYPTLNPATNILRLQAQAGRNCPPGWSRDSYGFCQPPPFGFQAGVIAGGAAALLTGQPELIPTAAMKGGEIGQLAEEAISKTDQFVQQYFRSINPYRPPAPQPFQPPASPFPTYPVSYPSGQPSGSGGADNGRVPYEPEQPAQDYFRGDPINPQDCPSCSSGQIQRVNRIRGQQQQLQQETDTERAQYSDQQLRQQDQQLEHFHDLEHQDPSGRNIPQELQQKAQLAQQLQQELQGYNQPAQPAAPAAPSGPVGPTVILDEQPLIEQPATFVQRQPTGENPAPNAPGSVKFCVQCASQNDSHLFLNGEPSNCSVVPE